MQFLCVCVLFSLSLFVFLFFVLFSFVNLFPIILNSK